MKYNIRLHKRAVKYYKSVDDKTAERINKAIEEISNDPFNGAHIKRLKGKLEGKYRYKIGNLRVVYLIKEENDIIFIEAIAPRGDIY